MYMYRGVEEEVLTFMVLLHNRKTSLVLAENIHPEMKPTTVKQIQSCIPQVRYSLHQVIRIQWKCSLNWILLSKTHPIEHYSIHICFLLNFRIMSSLMQKRWSFGQCVFSLTVNTSEKGQKCGVFLVYIGSHNLYACCSHLSLVSFVNVECASSSTSSIYTLAVSCEKYM